MMKRLYWQDETLLANDSVAERREDAYALYDDLYEKQRLTWENFFDVFSWATVMKVTVAFFMPSAYTRTGIEASVLKSHCGFKSHYAD